MPDQRMTRAMPHPELPVLPRRLLARPFPGAISSFTSDGTPDPAVNDAIGHAIQMDFGNYTIGGLIPHRANYDEKKPEYVRVRAKIERRMFDLGYRDERFKDADSDIGRTSWNAPDERKVDRYGKKYSWIAYFEMWGERGAMRKLPDWRQGNRTADCGVDPSFPKRPPDWTPPLPDLFGPPSATTEEWVAGGYTPNWAPLLIVPKIDGHEGEWVLVEGFAKGADSAHDRELFAFLRGMFVAKKDVDTLRSEFLAIDYPGNQKIPEGSTEHYMFGGEPGHRQSFARHLLKRDGQYRRQTVEAFEKYERDFSAGRKKSITIKIASMAGLATNDDERTVLEVDVPATRRIPGVRLELPSIHFGWESYHSVYNTFSGFDVPAPSLIQRLGLYCRNREIDFFDPSGRPATLFREAGHDWRSNQHRLLYVRADLLRRYLAETRQVLVWCNWGERDWLKKLEGYERIPNDGRQRVFQAHSHIHRTFSRWSAKDCTVL